MYYLAKFAVLIYFKIMYKLHFEGKENIPTDTTVIYACNHRSNGDPPLLGCGARGRFAFIAKE